MPSPEVIDLTLSDDEIQPDPIRSDQGPPTPTQATNRFRTSSSTPPTSGINRTRRILPGIQGTFAAIERDDGTGTILRHFRGSVSGSPAENRPNTSTAGFPERR